MAAVGIDLEWHGEGPWIREGVTPLPRPGPSASPAHSCNKVALGLPANPDRSAAHGHQVDDAVLLSFHLRTVPHDTAARIIRSAAMKRRGLQVEDEENVPDSLADEAVVAIVRVPLTAAVVPDDVFVKLKDAVPTPPATASSSASVSSIMISIILLLVYRCHSTS
jgi:hypothetical protein